MKGGSFWRELLVYCESPWLALVEGDEGISFLHVSIVGGLDSVRPWQDYPENLIYCLLKF